MMRPFMAATLLIIASAGSALACSCMPDYGRAEAIADADVVFRGKVTAVKEAGFWNQATMEVESVEKGEAGKEVTVTTAKDSAACGIDFTVGNSMEIAAIQRKDRLHASLCSQMGLQK